MDYNSSSLFTYLGQEITPIQTYCTDIGTGSYATPNFWGMLIGAPGTADPNYFNYSYGSDSQFVGAGVINNAYGFFGINRYSINDFSVWFDGSKKATNTNVRTNPPPTTTMYMPAPFGDGSNWSARRHQMDIIGQGFNDTEAIALATIINTFQTTLGRNVY